MSPSRTSYFTVARAAQAEIVVEKSRFISWIRRVDDESAARAVLEEARAEHWSARHHCSAFVLGPQAEIARSNDDGEPSGTAGMPMLQVLQRRDISDVVAVVIRYFGGRLLGTGGLARAYGDAVDAGLQSAGTLRRELVGTAQVTVPITMAGKVENLLRTRTTVRSSTYGNFAEFLVTATPGLAAQLAAETSGLATFAPLGSEWTDRP